MVDTWTPDPSGWRRAYREGGYLVVEGAVERALLQQMRAALQRLEDDFHAGRLPAHLRHWIQTERTRSTRRPT